MRKNIVGCILFLSFAAVVSGGCAKKDMVKADETVAAPPAPSERPGTGAATTAPREAAKPAPDQPAPLADTPTSETPVQPDTGRLQPREAVRGQLADLQAELQNIYFNFDSAALSDEARSTLSRNAELLAQQPSAKIRIEGHCDERGSDDYNMALGERRADAARDYLVTLGIQAERISTISYGEEKPVDPGQNEAAWAKNRRDEFVIVQ